jgi:nitric oxide reductase subunit C
MRSKKTKNNIIIITVLVSLFSIYNFFIYTSENTQPPVKLNPEASLGLQIWQENNCWSCHQVYGLGGYLGPDLTNIYSHPDKGESYIKAFLNTGVRTMPKFDFTEEEKDAIVAYLKHIDSTGYFPNYDAKFNYSGWVEIKNKHEK